MTSLCHSFDRLADVEVQLCMQFSPLPALLQIARCSRRLQTQADSPCAFKHAPPRVLVCSPPNPPVGLESLLRHVPVTLKPSVLRMELDRMAALLPARFHGVPEPRAHWDCVCMCAETSLRHHAASHRHFPDLSSAASVHLLFRRAARSPTDRPDDAGAQSCLLAGSSISNHIR